MAVLDILDRLEAAQTFLTHAEDIEEVILKLQNLDIYIRRFGSIRELANHMQFIEKKMYLFKEFLTVSEAADFIGLSCSHVYKMTSNHEIPVYKPNGKNIFLRRDDLNDWISKNKVPSFEEDQSMLKVKEFFQSCSRDPQNMIEETE